MDRTTRFPLIQGARNREARGGVLGSHVIRPKRVAFLHGSARFASDEMRRAAGALIRVRSELPCQSKLAVHALDRRTQEAR